MKKVQITPRYSSKDELMGDDPKSKYAEITGTAHGGQALRAQNMLML